MSPDLLTLLSISNEFDTDDSIEAMGARLAQELDQFLNLHVRRRPSRQLGRLSFVGHSLGGLIVRSALTQALLAPLLPHLYTYLALGTPHLGYIHGNNLVTGTGLWMLRRLSGSKSLAQLSLLDAPADNPAQSYLWGLAQAPALAAFRHVLLVASHQDTYVPHASATIQITRDTSRHGAVANAMAENLLRQLDGVNVTRFHVSFVGGGGAAPWNLDQLIGRAAHISFLDQPLYIHMLTHVYSEYFARCSPSANTPPPPP